MLFGLLPLAQKDDHEKGGEHKINTGGVKGDQPAHQAAQCGPTHPGALVEQGDKKHEPALVHPLGRLG